MFSDRPFDHRFRRSKGGAGRNCTRTCGGDVLCFFRYPGSCSGMKPLARTDGRPANRSVARRFRVTTPTPAIGRRVRPAHRRSTPSKPRLSPRKLAEPGDLARGRVLWVGSWRLEQDRTDAAGRDVTRQSRSHGRRTANRRESGERTGPRCREEKRTGRTQHTAWGNRRFSAPPASSIVPCAARCGRHPRSRLRRRFSTTTIAGSSTTIPTASTSAEQRRGSAISRARRRKK